jgi:hypothetical protein
MHFGPDYSLQVQCVNNVTFINNSVTLSLQPFSIFQTYFYMNKMKKAGLIIIVAGALLTIFTAFSFFTRQEIVKIGDLVITANKSHNFRWSPLIGIGIMGIGGVFVWQSPKKQ